MSTVRTQRLWLLALSVCTVLAACGTGRTMVMEAPQRKAFTQATVTRAEDTVSVPEEYRVQFVNKLNALLYGTKEGAGPFTQGPGLTIRVKVIQFEAGNQFQRWFWGGIGNAGEGSMSLLAEYFDGDRKLGQTQVEGRIGSGFFGGSMTEAVDKAAEQVAKYAISNFR